MRGLGQFILEKRRLRDNVHKYLEGGCKGDGARLFSMVPSNRTRGNGQKLEHKGFPVNTRKHFFTEGDLGLAQFTQGVCGASTLGLILRLTGHSPGQLGLGGPASV